MDQQTTSKMKKIGFIGIGKLGLDCAEVMAEKHEVRGYDIYPRTSDTVKVCGIEELVNPTRVNEIKKEIKDFLDINRSSDLDKKVEDIVKKKFKGDKDLEKYVVDVTRNVLIQLYKTMYTRRGFWSSDLKNSPN